MLKSNYVNLCINFFHFVHLKSTFLILHTYFYKTPASVCLFYTFIQIKYLFLYPHNHQPTATDPHRHHTGIHTTHRQQTQQTRKTNPTTRSTHPESTQPNNTIHTIQQPGIETNPATQSTQPTQNRRLALSNKIDAFGGDGENEKQDQRLQRQAVAMTMAMARDIQTETH